MLFTLAAVVFFGAIITFFSQEFIKTFKKIMSIKGAKLVVPLLLATCFVVIYNQAAVTLIFYYRLILHKMVNILMYILPFGYISSHIGYILILSFLTLAPVFAFDYFIHRKTNYHKYNHTYLVSMFIWVISVVTLLVF